MKNSHHQKGNDSCRDSCPWILAPKRPNHPCEQGCNNCSDRCVVCQETRGEAPDSAGGPDGWGSPAIPWFDERLVQQTPDGFGKNNLIGEL